jgi:hypothetical protein
VARAFVTYLVRQALPGRALAAARPAYRVALAGWLPAVAIGAAQSALLFAVLGAFDVVMDSPVGVAVFLLLPAAVFAAVNQAFVAVLGPRRGWMVSITRGAPGGVPRRAGADRHRPAGPAGVERLPAGLARRGGGR